jgi:hypothetical protein
MSCKQKWILGLGTTCFLMAGLFPPWIETIHVGRIYKRAALPWTGHSIFQSPLPTSERFAQFTSIEIDTSRLSVLWILVIILTFFAWWLARSGSAGAVKKP